MGWWMALDGRRRTFVVLTAAVVFVSIAYALNIRFVLAGQQAVTAIDDICEAVTFVVAGSRAFWSDSALGTSSRWRVWFDGVIVALALTSTAWGFGLRTV